MGYKYEVLQYNWHTGKNEQVHTSNSLFKALVAMFKAKKDYPCVSLVWR